MITFGICILLGITIGTLALWLLGVWQPRTGHKQAIHSNRHHL